MSGRHASKDGVTGYIRQALRRIASMKRSDSAEAVRNALKGVEHHLPHFLRPAPAHPIRRTPLQAIRRARGFRSESTWARRSRRPTTSPPASPRPWRRRSRRSMGGDRLKVWAGIARHRR